VLSQPKVWIVQQGVRLPGTVPVFALANQIASGSRDEERCGNHQGNQSVYLKLWPSS
jgi:hypothetical protein